MESNSVFGPLSGLFLDCGEAKLQEAADSLRFGIDAVVEAIIIQAPDEIVVGHEEDFGFLAGHGSSIPDSGRKGNKVFLDNPR